MNLGGPFIDLMLGERPRNPGPGPGEGHHPVALIFPQAGQSGPVQAALEKPLAPFPGPAGLLE
jgi:hypothetical protein